MPCQPDITIRRVVPITRVVEQKTPVVVRPQETRTLVRDARRPVVVRPQETDVTTLKPVTRVVKVVSPGPMGPPGPSADGIPAIPFSWGDAAHVVAHTPFAGIIRGVRVDFSETPFNGANPTVTVGFVGAVDALMLAEENDPRQAASYDVAVGVPVAEGVGIWLAITPDIGTTHGAGVLYVDLSPET